MLENLLREWLELSTHFPVVGIFQALAPFILPALGALRGGTGREQRQRSTEAIDFTESGTRGQSGFQRPVISEDVLPLRADIISGFQNLLGSPTGISEEALNQAELAEIQGTNELFRRLGANARSNLAGRGLSFSPGAVGTLEGNLIGQRGRALADLSGNFARQRFLLPQLEEAIRLGRLGSAGSFLQSIPFGTESESTADFTSTRRGTTTRDTTGRIGGGLRGALGGAAEAGAFLLGSGDFGQPGRFEPIGPGAPPAVSPIDFTGINAPIIEPTFSPIDPGIFNPPPALRRSRGDDF